MKLKDLFKKVENANEIREMYDEKDNWKYCVVYEDEDGHWENFEDYEVMMKWFKDEYIEPIPEYVKDCEIIIGEMQEYCWVDMFMGVMSFKYKFFINKERNKNV